MPGSGQPHPREPRRKQTHRQRGADYDNGETGGRKTDAIDIGSLPLARHGQNERELALGRKSWLFAGSEPGAERAAAMATLINTAKLNEVDPQAWLAEVLARIAAMPQGRLPELLPWEWARSREAKAA